MRVKFFVPFTCNLAADYPLHSDEVEEDDDQVHAFQIDDAKIDVSYVTFDNGG